MDLALVRRLLLHTKTLPGDLAGRDAISAERARLERNFSPAVRSAPELQG